MCVCLCVCVCVHVFVCMYVTNVCKKYFNYFNFEVAYRMKNGMCVYDCVRACVCVCVCVANGCTYMFDSLGSEGVKENGNNRKKNKINFKQTTVLKT